MRSRLARWVFFPEAAESLALARIVLVAATLVFLAVDPSTPEPAMFLSPGGRPQSFFRFLPFPLPNAILASAQVLWVLSLLSALIGFRARFSLALAFLTGLIVHGYGSNFGRTYHHSQLVLTLLFVLAISPSGDALSWDSRKFPRPAPSERYSWGLRLGQFLIALFYSAAGFAKIFSSGWRWAWSENLAYFLSISTERTDFGDWLLAQNPLVLRTIAGMVLTAECGALLALMSRRLSFIFLTAWTAMHLGIYFAMGDHDAFLILPFTSIFFLAPLLQRMVNSSRSSSR